MLKKISSIHLLWRIDDTFMSKFPNGTTEDFYKFQEDFHKTHGISKIEGEPEYVSYECPDGDKCHHLDSIFRLSKDC